MCAAITSEGWDCPPAASAPPSWASTQPCTLSRYVLTRHLGNDSAAKIAGHSESLQLSPVCWIDHDLPTSSLRPAFLDLNAAVYAVQVPC